MRKPSQELRELLIDARIGDAQTRARKVFNLSQDEEEECVLDCIVSFECVRE